MATVRLLLLEDKQRDTEAIQTVLTDGGMDYQLLRVDSRASFVTALETETFDVILAAYAMPGFGGIAALEIACSLCPDVPFIFVSASLGEEVAIEALKRGATDYVLKQRLERLVPCVQRALRESQERRKRQQVERERDRFLAVGSDLQVITGINSYFQWVSPTFEQVLGWSVDEMISRPWTEFVHPDDIPASILETDSLFSGNATLSFENRYRHKDGSYRWLHWNAQPYPDEQVIYGAAVDITEAKRIEAARKQAEIASQESEARLKLALKTGKLGSWQLDIQTNQLSTSDQCKINYGFSPEVDFTHQVLLNRIHPDDRAWVQAAIERAIEQQTDYDVEYRTIWNDDSIHWALVRGCTIYDADGTPLQMVGMSLDITERKQAEAALRQSEQQSQSILESISEAFFALNQNWQFTYVNGAAQVLLDRTPDDLIGKNLWQEYPGLSGNELVQVFWSAMRDRVAASLTAFYPDHDRWYEVRTYSAPNGITVYFRDVTEQIQAAATLRQSEERYRTLFESIDEGFCVVEMLFDQNNRPIDYRVLEINPAFEQQTGLQQAVGKTARQLSLEDHWIEVYGQVALTGEAVRFENGSETLNRWFDVYACCTGEPEARKVAIVFKDISDRKRVEKLLRRTAKLDAFRVSLADALRPLADPVEIQATASRLLGEHLDANRVAYFEVRGADYVVERDYVKGAEALTGSYSVDSFGPKLLEAYRTGRAVVTSHVEADPNLSPDQRSAYAAIQIGAYIGIPLVKKGEFVAGLAVHTAGSRTWTPDEVSLTEEVAERTWAAVERARVEAALRDSENRFRMAIESAQLGTWDWNLITHQLVWDEGCKAMFGLPPEAESSIEVFFAGLHPDDRDRLEQVVQWALNPASGGKYDVEYRTIGIQDGAERWLAARGQVYFDAADKPRRFVGTVLNITEKKRIEAEREQLLAREQTAREAADRANRIKDEFLAVLSHELRSPLNPILGWSRLLQTGKLDASRQAEALATIERNAKLQAQLIEDLLDISRIMQGKLSLTVAPVSLAFVISAAVETVRLAAEAKHIQLRLDFDAETPFISGDAARLQQVVWNLLTNAVKFTPHGGQVGVELRQVDHLAQIRVIDTGKGIQPQFLPHVFEYFRQEDSSTTRKFGGLGLGLAIVRQIVEMHGGTVRAESSGENQGATFFVQLPTAQQSAPIVSEPAHPQVGVKAPLDDIQILLVDDDTDTREFQAFLLEQNGAKVTAVASGLEALQILEQFIPSVIVSDIGMAEMDGYKLIQQIRSRLAIQGKTIPAIALTAYAAELDQQRALQAGFQMHITKPVEPEKLVNGIVDLLRHG